MSTHNIDVAVIRQAITKLVSLLTQKSIKVTQRGVQAFVEYDSRGNIKRMNIPFLADDAPIELIAAVQGFVDHEVGHVLDSKSSVLLKSVKKGSAVASMTNIIEDVYIEGCMTRRFAGSGENLDAVRRYMIAGAAEKVNSAIRSGDKGTATAYLMVHLIRAWGGQKLCREFITSNEPIKEIVALLENKIGHDLLAKVAAVSCSEESLKLAIEIADRIKSKDEAIARKKEKKKESEKRPEEDKSDMTDSDTDSAEGGEPDPDPSTEPTDESEPDDDDTGKGSVTEPEEQPPEDNEEAAADDSETSTEGGEAKTSTEEQERDQEDDSTGSASEPTTDEELDEEESRPAGDTEYLPEPASEPDDEPEPDEGEIDGAGMGDSTDGADTVAEGSPEDADDGDGDSDTDAPPDEESPGSITPSTLAGDEGGIDESDRSAGAAEEDEDDELGEGDEELDLDKLFEATPVSDDAMSEVLSAAATSGARGSKYMIFSQEFDKIEPLSSHAPESVVSAMVSHVAPMVAPMAKSLQRALAAKDKVTWNPGMRRGRINPGALYRTSTGDDRVFRQRYETRAKNTAVTLLIDCSGSMRHDNRIKSAAYAAFALSSTLERLKISHEVIGFTTTLDRQGEMLRAMRPDLQRDIFYPRSEPLYMPVFKGFDERLSFEQQSRIAYLLTYEAAFMLRENVDGESLRIAARRIANVKADRRLVLVLSDGSPSCPAPDAATTISRDASYEAAGGYPLTMDLINAVNEVTSSGIEVVGVGIQHAGVKRFYPKSINLAKLSELPTKVMDQLTTMLLA